MPACRAWLCLLLLQAAAAGEHSAQPGERQACKAQVPLSFAARLPPSAPQGGFTGRCASPAGGSATAALKSLYAYSFTAPPRGVARGLHSLGNMLRLRRVAQKLVDGANVSVAVAGGSISRGWGDSTSRASADKGYVGRFVEWMRSAYAAPGQKITNKGGAIGAVMSPMYASCTTRLVKETADLVFVEFVQNDLYRAGGLSIEKDPRRKAFERLLRNLLRYPKRPAVVVFMVFPHINSFWPTAENDMLVLAQYYGLPILSVRAAFYPQMAHKQPGFRLDGVYDPSKPATKAYFFNTDNVHPWSRSYQFLAELGISMMQQATHSVMLSPYTEEEENVVTSKADIPPPMFPGNDGMQSNSCVLNEELRAAAVPGLTDRFVWYDEGRRKWGWWTNDTAPGATITLEVNTQHQSPATLAGGASSPVMVAFGCLHSGTKPMGIAEVSCVAGCTCAPIKINAKWNPQVSLTNITPLKASQHPRCHIKFQMLEGAEGLGHWFKISVMMVFDYAGSKTSALDLFGDLATISVVERTSKSSAPS